MSISLVLAVVLPVCIAFGLVESKYMIYNTSQGIVPGKLNVHLVPHTHDDVGWLKTIDQYYVGSNNSIQGACVQNVLDSLVQALLADKNRKFVYVEQAFFQRWWRDQSPTMQSAVKLLVDSGQLEFINGGMCMHDEATTHYIDMIDQTTLGHRFLKEEFDVTPRIGWQIDPFGHSAVQAYLLGAEVGFDSLFFARIDYQDRAKRSADRTLEVIWQGSRSSGPSSQIFSGAFYAGNYEPPTGFYFEVNADSPVVQDNIDLFDYNVQDRVNDFVSAAISQANATRSNHIMWTMGTDFKYQYSHSWFRNMDKLIHYVNQDGRVNAFYSTPSIYTDAKYALDKSWPLKKDDYFPYADNENGYWTGYFTSRPALKGYIRIMSGYYLAARQLEFFIGRNKSGSTTDSLADALAIAQHHDAVTGTEQQHVADDYAKRLSIGYKESEEVIASALGCMTQMGTSSPCKNPLSNFVQCPLLNMTYCPPTEIDLSLRKKLVVLLYNSVGWKRTAIVRIPVINVNVTIKDSTGKLILSQIVPVVNASIADANFFASAYMGISPSTSPKYWLSFKAVVPPLGFNSYVISSDKAAVSFLSEQSSYSFKWSQTGPIEVGSGQVKLMYSGINGKLMRYINNRSQVNISLEQSFSYYTGHDRKNDSQASGAYVFRPNGSFPIASEVKVPLTVFRGPLFDEVHQMINPWIYQITRVYGEKEHVEFEFKIGPIPIDDGFGKEIVTRITSTIGNKKMFYTDSNGRDFLERIRDYRTDWDLQVNQPIAGNYYPINLGAYIKDKNVELSVLVDRSVGGSSVADGELEIMLHRRLIYDDGKGVAEALNETVCFQDKCLGLTIQGKYYVKLDPVGEGSKWRRSFGQEIYSPVLLAFSVQDDEWTNFSTSTFSAMDPSYNLPDNVAIITLQELENGKVLFRLAHLYEIGEDKDLSIMASVELKKVFSRREINAVKETSLSANQGKEEMEKKRLSWKVEGSSTNQGRVLRGGAVDPVNLVVELAPMEIRTFIVDFNSNLAEH